MAATTGLFAPKRIYVIGGILSIGMATNATYAYDPERDAWTVGASMPFPRSGFALAVVDDVLYAIGGFDGWTIRYSENLRYRPFGYGTIPVVVSPQNNGNYTSGNVPFTFELSVQALTLSYSLDGGAKVPLPGNFTLNELANGEHTITIYATDEQGNTSTLQTITFNVDNTLLTTLIAASIATVAITCIGLLVYLKKRQH